MVEEKMIVSIDDAPKVETTPIVEIPSNNTVDKMGESQIHFEITSPAETAPQPVELSQGSADPASFQKPEPTAVPQHVEQTKDASNKSTLSSESFLARPAQIYAEDEPSVQSNTKEELQPQQTSLQEDEPVLELQLVVKNSQKAAEEEPIEQVQPIMMSPVEEPAMQDETEELRRRAKERIAKLRNLSFNVNSSDPNNEFETVPAYLRRNMEMHNQIADVESFYSNYTVKNNADDQPVISTLNTFLDGKKPD
jgi:cell division protein FtsZ